MKQGFLSLTLGIFIFVMTSGVADARCATCPGPDGGWGVYLQQHGIKKTQKECKKTLKEAKNNQDLASGHTCMALVYHQKSLKHPAGGTFSDDRGNTYLVFDSPGPGKHKKAMEQINQAIAATPDNIALHVTRLQLVDYPFYYEEMPALLKESLAVVASNSSADDWLNFSYNLFNANLYHIGIAFTEILYQHFPDDHRVVANLGTFHLMLQQDDEAEKYLKIAVQMSPDDPINNWNLARLYDYNNRIEEADRYYQVALKNYRNTDQETYVNCVYADFVENKLKLPIKAKDIRKKYQCNG